MNNGPKEGENLWVELGVRCHLDSELELHLGVQAHADLMGSKGPDRLLAQQAAAVQLDAKLSFHSLRDVSREIGRAHV